MPKTGIVPSKNTESILGRSASPTLLGPPLIMIPFTPFSRSVFHKVVGAKISEYIPLSRSLLAIKRLY